MLNMGKIMDRSLVLTFDELEILLYNLGFRQVYGVRMPEKEFTEAEVLTAMHRLAAAGHVTAEDDGFVYDDGLRRTLLTMGDPAATFVVTYGEEERQAFCYEGKDRMVLSQLHDARPRCLLIRDFRKNAFRKWLKDMDAEIEAWRPSGEV